MKYLGGKSRIAKYIVPIMVDTMVRRGLTTFVDQFVGGGNMIQHVPPHFERIGVDINPHTIAALTCVRDCPEKVPYSWTEEQYRATIGTPPEPVSSYLRFACSFGGKFEAGYARNALGYDFVEQAKRHALRQSPLLQGVRLEVGSYDEYEWEDVMIYCDPPYKGTTGYKGAGKFDHDRYYQWVRERVASGCIVFCSEYKMPEDFNAIWAQEQKTGIANNIREQFTVIERLFVHESQAEIVGVRMPVQLPLIQ